MVLSYSLIGSGIGNGNFTIIKCDNKSPGIFTPSQALPVANSTPLSELKVEFFR